MLVDLVPLSLGCRMSRLIFDCFTFFNELDLLEVRLEELAPCVDFFVICEASVTFQGKPKPLHFQENRQRFAKYLHKIIHVVVDDLPNTENPWDREYAQRDALARGCTIAQPDDIVLISDADEIYRRETIARIRGLDGYMAFDMPMFQYFINLRAEASGWSRAFGITWKDRDKLLNFTSGRVDKHLVKDAFGDRYHEIDMAGWHFTYLGGAEKIRTKLQSFSHTEEWFKVMLADGGIEDQVRMGGVVGNFWHLAEYVPIDESFPISVQRRVDHFKAIGFIKDVYEAHRELQVTHRNLKEKLKEQIGIISQLQMTSGMAAAHSGQSAPAESAAPKGAAFQNLISVGTYCVVAAHLKEAGLRNHSYPFDWLFSNPSMVADCLEDDFAVLLDRQYLVPIENGTKCRHEFYQAQYSMPKGAIFNHQNIADDAQYETFVRRVERLRTALQSPEETLLVMMMGGASYYGGVPAQIERIKRAANNTP